MGTMQLTFERQGAPFLRNPDRHAALLARMSIPAYPPDVQTHEVDPPASQAHFERVRKAYSAVGREGEAKIGRRGTVALPIPMRHRTTPYVFARSPETLQPDMCGRLEEAIVPITIGSVHMQMVPRKGQTTSEIVSRFERYGPRAFGFEKNESIGEFPSLGVESRQPGSSFDLQVERKPLWVMLNATTAPMLTLPAEDRRVRIAFSRQGGRPELKREGGGRYYPRAAAQRLALGCVPQAPRFDRQVGRDGGAQTIHARSLWGHRWASEGLGKYAPNRANGKPALPPGA